MGGSAEANKAAVRRFVEGYQTGADEAVADELIADDFVNHAEVPGVPNDKQGVKILFAGFHRAFPDFLAEIHEQVAEGDLVVTRKTFHGTHRGDLMGIPPTGRPVAFDVIDIVRMRDGQIVEHWNVVDQMGLMRQLGVMPGAA
jgi:steroid delta-isomerase-like uncharacterized protein